MYILKAKAWQLLVALLIPFIIGRVLPMGDLENIVANFLLYAIIFGWLLLLGVNLNSILPERLQMPDNFFLINCLYLLIISISNIILPELIIENDYQFLSSIVLIYFMFAFIHVVHFIAKAITLGERNRPVDIDEYKFKMLLLFIIVGVCILQPRINKIYNNYAAS